MRIAVVGSGPSALSAARALVRRGLKPTLLDVGETLDETRSAAVQRLEAAPPDRWSPADLDLVTHNPMIAAGGVPRKLVFGSDFIFAQPRPGWEFAADSAAPCATFAFGGFSQAWGGAMLPAADVDMQDWPISRAELEPSYRRVLADMPLSAVEADGLAADFPVYRSGSKAIQLPGQVRSLLSDIEADLSRRNGGAEGMIRVGQARLAVRADDDADGRGCVYCGLCLTGCPKNSVFRTDLAIQRLASAGLVEYRNGHQVLSFVEDEGGVTVEFARGGGRSTERFDRVFVGAGVINTSRILIHSLQWYGERFEIRDSQKFVVPMLRADGSSGIEWPAINTFAGLFLEARLPGLSDHWIHLQISGLNDYIIRRLHLDPYRRSSLALRAATPLLSRMMVAWFGLHSDHSHRQEMTVRLAANGGDPIQALRDTDQSEARRFARRTAWALARRAIRWRVAMMAPAIVRSPAFSTGHIGGAFPMSARPGARHADTLGRLGGLKRVHAIDATIFPSIPGTTILLPIMANADRIVAATPLD